MNQSSLYNCFHSFQWLEIEVRRLLVLYKGCYRTSQWFIGKWRLTEGIWEKGWDHSVASHTSRCVQKRESTSESWYVACYCVTADTEWPCSWSLEAVPTALWSIVIFWVAHWSISLDKSVCSVYIVKILYTIHLLFWYNFSLVFLLGSFNSKLNLVIIYSPSCCSKPVWLCLLWNIK